MHTSLRTILAAATLAGATVALPAALQAQACLGNASFTAGKVRVGGDVTFGDDVTTIGPNLAFGGRQGPFAGVSLDVIDVDRLDDNGLRVGVNGGWQIPLGEGTRRNPSRAQLCPVAALGFMSGPDIGPIDVSGTDLSAGFAVGAPFTLSPEVELVPFGGLSVLWARTTVEDRSESDTGGRLDLGAGFVFSRRFTARVGVAVPLGFDGADSRFGLGFGINFGGPPCAYGAAGLRAWCARTARPAPPPSSCHRPRRASCALGRDTTRRCAARLPATWP